MALPSLWRQSSLRFHPSSAKFLGNNIFTRRSSAVTENQETNDAKPFHKIPGPLSLPIIGTLYLSRVPHHYKSAYAKYEKYGPLVREEILPGRTTVWVFDPIDMEHIFQSENSYPLRQSHLAVKVFREDRPEIYNTGGLLPVNGEDWWRLRREFQKGLSAPQTVRGYLPATDTVIQEFVSSRLDSSVSDFLPDLSRLFLQLLFTVVFHEECDCFSYKETRSGSRTSRLIDATLQANSLIPLFDLVSDVKKVSSWKKFEEAMLYMEEIAVELVQKKAAKIASLEKDKDIAIPSLLELYLTSPNLDHKDVVGMAVDLLLAGIDTTTYTASFALYHIAKNQRVQKLLRLEAQNLLESSSQPITADILAKAPYARAVLKEVFRLNPISVGVGRIATQNMVLSGYQIPKGTNLVTMNQVSSGLAKYFERPSEFIPERWLKGSPIQATVNPYVVLPFGHGPRACIARRLAEQHLLTLLLRVVQKYSIMWVPDKDLDCKTDLINKPDQELNLCFSRL